MGVRHEAGRLYAPGQSGGENIGKALDRRSAEAQRKPVTMQIPDFFLI